jgi:hypothetical protein
MNTLTAKLKKL